MMKSLLMRLGFIGCFAILSSASVADVFHYNNVLIGDRAVGLGGAYAGISDDASGVYYNPAGLAFALSNDVSGSANALYTKKVEYKKTLGDQSFVENSGGTLAPFFGGLQKLDHLAKGLVFAFGVYTPDSELKDQDDLIEDATIAQTATVTSKVDRLRRTANQRSTTSYFGGAVGYRISSNFSVGFGLNYITIDELYQEYQDIMQSVTNTEEATFSATLLSQNLREHMVAYGIEPVLGFQLSLLGKISLGLTIKTPMIVSETYDKSFEMKKVVYQDETEYENIKAQSSSTTGYSPKAGAGVLIQNSSAKEDDIMDSLPPEVRLGAAIFASTRLLLAFDVIYKGDVTPAPSNAGYKNKYKREAVTNFAAGVEYYVLPQMPMRLGLFTNNDARPMVDDSKKNQADHIDFMGESLFVSWAQANSQISLGLILQQGTGKAQKISQTTQTQDVVASMQTVGFSASHSF